MELKLAVLADAANVSAEGKLNIFGIFNLIGANAYPVMHPQLHLVMSFSADSAEQGRTRAIEVQFSGPDGQRIVTMEKKLTIPKGVPGYPVGMNHIHTLNGLVFEKPGDYSFNILVDNDVKGNVSLMVRPQQGQ